MNFYRIICVISFFIYFSSSNVFAAAIPYWRFEPNVYRFVQGDLLDLKAVLCNDSIATNDLIASSVTNGAGVNWLPGENLYEKGLNIQFADISQQLNSIILRPGECHNFVWGTVSSWKVILSGQYSIDYASINGHNSSASIVADNVFTIIVTKSTLPIFLQLLLKE
jgi:hypothetical protein